MASLHYAVPRVFWESFETLLRSESRRYVRELADILEVDRDELVKAVLPTKDTIKVYIQDPPEVATDMMCKAYTSLAGGDFATRCGCPVVLHTSYCAKHTHVRPTVQSRIDQSLPIPKMVTRLRAGPECPSLWVDAKGNVWDAGLRPAGSFNQATGALKYAVIRGDPAHPLTV
jgi:hypothetical protein